MARILVVDDEESIRELLKDLLTMDGHEVDQAADGAEAVAAVKKKTYDLVILDRNMPKTDGILALTIMRCNDALKNMKVIMCTSVSVNKEVEEAFEAGACDYILKPLNLPVLIKKVNKALGKS